MKIGPLVPRGSGGTRCPYCHDDIQAGPRCTACGARYHQDCAQMFGACAIQACRGEVVTAGPAQVLPRLSAMARWLGKWEAPSGGPRALILDGPAPKAVRDDPEPAARLVAELIGQSVYDGRMRVLSPFPEPLVRVRSDAEAERLCARLAKVGLFGIAPRLDELLAPINPFVVVDCELGDHAATLTEAGGERITLPNAAPRLILSTGLVTVSSPHSKKLLKRTYYAGTRGGRSSVRAAKPQRDKQERQLCAYLLRANDPRPLLLRQHDQRSLTREPDRMLVAEAARFRRLTGALQGRTAPRSFPEVLVSNQAFLSPSDKLGKKRDNSKFVALLARLSRLAWLKRREQKPGRSK